MKNDNISEFGISLLLIALLVVLLNPFNFWMQSTLLMVILAVFVALFAFYISFFWREKASDEREELHRMVAGRYAFFAGSGVLILGVVVESLQHDLDAWLVFALLAMIITKVIGRLYSKINH